MLASEQYVHTGAWRDTWLWAWHGGKGGGRPCGWWRILLHSCLGWRSGRVKSPGRAQSLGGVSKGMGASVAEQRGSGEVNDERQRA